MPFRKLWEGSGESSLEALPWAGMWRPFRGFARLYNDPALTADRTHRQDERARTIRASRGSPMKALEWIPPCTTLALLLSVALSTSGCRPAVPVESTNGPAAVAADTPHAQNGEAPSDSTSDVTPHRAANSSNEAGPTVTTIIDELSSILNAALAGRDLPDLEIGVPGTRGEQLVTVGGEGFPTGDLTVVATLLKIDVTLTGCGPDGGLTVGVVQSPAGLHVVGLGDQFVRASGETPESLHEVATVAEHILSAIARDQAGSMVIDDATCEAHFGGAAQCRRVFGEVPTERTLERYREMLTPCEADPTITLSFVALWLRDESGAIFQGAARMETVRGQPSLTGPITIARDRPSNVPLDQPASAR